MHQAELGWLTRDGEEPRNLRRGVIPFFPPFHHDSFNVLRSHLLILVTICHHYCGLRHEQLMNTAGQVFISPRAKLL